MLVQDSHMISICEVFCFPSLGHNITNIDDLSQSSDLLQHLVIAVATPVCPCGLHQFEVMAETHIRHVRATARIDIFFMMVQARLVIMGNVFIKNGDFIGLATLSRRFHALRTS